MVGWGSGKPTAVNSIALLTASGLYWLRSRNFLRMKKILCLPKFCMLNSGKLGMEEENKLHILSVQTLPLSPGS